jgi:hypothetical protein
MSLRSWGIEPDSGLRGYGADRFAGEGSLVNRLAQNQGYADAGGVVGVGPVTLSTGTPDSGAARAPVRFVTGQTAHGDGLDYRPAAGLPPVGLLEYVQKFSVSTLAAIGLLVVIVMVIRSPRRAFRWIAHSGVKRAGLE